MASSRVLILDEGTANLDEETEATIADLIEKMSITRIVVAHRPALIQRAKRVFRVKERQISEVPRREFVAGRVVASAPVKGTQGRAGEDAFARGSAPPVDDRLPARL